MKKTVYWVLALIFCFYATKVHATMWGNIPLDELIHKSDFVIVGSVSNETAYFSTIPQGVEPDLKHIRSQGRLVSIKVEKVLFTSKSDSLTLDTAKAFFILETPAQGDAGLPMAKGEKYLLFLNNDTAVDYSFVRDKGLSKENYVWPAHSALQSVKSFSDKGNLDYIAGTEQLCAALLEKSKTRTIDILNGLSKHSNSEISNAANKELKKLKNN